MINHRGSFCRRRHASRSRGLRGDGVETEFHAFEPLRCPSMPLPRPGYRDRPDDVTSPPIGNGGIMAVSWR